MSTNWPRVSWTEAEPERLERELESVPAVAPALRWVDGSWRGHLPVWPFERPRPADLDAFLGDRRLEVQVLYLESYPMTAPRFVPIDPEPPIWTRSMSDWHVNPDGSLCLLQSTDAWDPAGTAAELVAKAAGWFLEFLLLSSDQVESMTESGIVHDDRLDHLFRGPA